MFILCVCVLRFPSPCAPLFCLEVCRVHATVFSELGAVVSNMVRFGRGEAQVRAFLDYMCARSQLVEDQVQGGFLADQVRPKPPKFGRLGTAL